MPTRLPLISIEVRNIIRPTHRPKWECDLCKLPRTVPYYRITRLGSTRSKVIKYWCDLCTAKHYLKQYTSIRLTGQPWYERAPDRPVQVRRSNLPQPDRR